MGWLEDELAKKLRFPLMQRVNVECWQASEACKAVGSDK